MIEHASHPHYQNSSSSTISDQIDMEGTTYTTPPDSLLHLPDMNPDSIQAEKNPEQIDESALGKEQHGFNLTIPTDDEELPRKKFRLETKFFALACLTHKTSEILFSKYNNKPKYVFFFFK